MALQTPVSVASTTVQASRDFDSATQMTVSSTKRSTSTMQNNPMSLLFIVRSGSSTNKTEEDRRQINRRAQQNAHVKRQQARQRRLHTTASRLVVPEASYEREQGTEPETGKTSWPQAVSLTTTIGPSDDYRAPSVRTYLDTRKLDPFSSGRAPMTPQMESIFMHYMTVLLPVIEPIQSERDEFHRWLVPLTVTEPALLYSLSACFAYDMEMGSVYGFGPTARKNMTQERVLYRIRAIQALNECLADPEGAQKPSTLLAVHYLLWHEIFAGDECVHLDGVQRILQLRGGFHGVQRKAIEGVMVGAFWRAIRTHSRPQLPRIADDMDISDGLFQQVLIGCEPSLVRMGEGLFESQVSSYLDEKMTKLFQDARVTWICFERIGLHDFTVEEKRLVSMKRADIDQRFQSFQFDYYSGQRPVQEALRIAYIIFSNAHYNVVQSSSKVARCLVEDFKKALEQTDIKNCWGDAYEAFIWSTFLGAHMSAGQRERPWFVMALARATQRLKSPTWIQIRAILTRFYYIDRVFQDEWRQIWEEADLLRNLLPDIS
jgi:hypothetical protein